MRPYWDHEAPEAKRRRQGLRVAWGATTAFAGVGLHVLAQGLGVAESNVAAPLAVAAGALLAGGVGAWILGCVGLMEADLAPPAPGRTISLRPSARGNRRTVRAV